MIDLGRDKQVRMLNFLGALSRRVRASWLRIATVLCLSYVVMEVFSDDPEIEVVLGEPWEEMRQRSTASISAAIPGHVGGFSPKSNASFRLVDEQFGFVTPSTNFLIVGFDNERVDSVLIHPHKKPLSMDDALEVVSGLQSQWARGGWFSVSPKERPPILDTPEWRAKLHDSAIVTYWQAADKYQVMLIMHRFGETDDSDARYRIIVSLAKPWVSGEIDR